MGETFGSVGVGAGRLCALVLMQMYPGVGLGLTKSAFLFCSLTHVWHLSYHPGFGVMLLPQAQQVLHWPSTLCLSETGVVFVSSLNQGTKQWSLCVLCTSSHTCADMADSHPVKERPSVHHGHLDTSLPLNGSVLQSCLSLLQGERDSREMLSSDGKPLSCVLAHPSSTAPQKLCRDVAALSKQSQKQVPWFLYASSAELFQACMI